MSIPTSSERGLDDLPDHIHGFALMHMAMRRDARRLVAAAPTLTPATVEHVGAWWLQVRNVIDWHHRSEDDVLWPELRRRVRGLAAGEQAMHGDHVALDQAMAEVSAALVPHGDLADLHSAATRFDALLHDHLRHEEAVVFPIFSVDLTVDEYVAIEKKVIESAPLGTMAFVLPWMFDGVSGPAAARVAATIPPPVRLLGSTALRWRYHRRWRWW